jgi:hypothetical protein
LSPISLLVVRTGVIVVFFDPLVLRNSFPIAVTGFEALVFPSNQLSVVREGVEVVFVDSVELILICVTLLLSDNGLEVVDNSLVKLRVVEVVVEEVFDELISSDLVVGLIVEVVVVKRLLLRGSEE